MRLLDKKIFLYDNQILGGIIFRGLLEEQSKKLVTEFGFPPPPNNS